LIYCFTFAIAILIFGSVNAPFETRMAIPGLIGLGGSIALFEWARQSVQGKVFSYIFSNDTPEFLWTSGPYAYIRNPFYVSYLLSYIAVAIMFPGIASLVVVTGMTIYFHAAARHEERKFGRSPLAEEYEAYRRRTGRFIPRLRR
jgi:protein-S-isoprenylcysteine O-methyltransferase Ste14